MKETKRLYEAWLTTLSEKRQGEAGREYTACRKSGATEYEAIRAVVYQFPEGAVDARKKLIDRIEASEEAEVLERKAGWDPNP